jgi:hypothetical protein
MDSPLPRHAPGFRVTAEDPEVAGARSVASEAVFPALYRFMAWRVSAAIRIWLWHKDRDAVAYSYGSPGDVVVAVP